MYVESGCDEGEFDDDDDDNDDDGDGDDDEDDDDDDDDTFGNTSCAQNCFFLFLPFYDPKLMMMMVMMMMVKADLCERPRSAMYACNCPAVAQVGHHDLAVLIVDLFGWF